MEPSQDPNSYAWGSQQAGGDEVDPADQWVLDPVSGEYRLRLPGEQPPPAAPQARPAADAEAAARRASEAGPGPGGAEPGSGSRRAARAPQRTLLQAAGPWAAGAMAVLSVAGMAVYLTHGAGAGTALAARPTLQPSCPAPSPTPDPAASVLSGPKAKPIDVRVTVYDGSSTFGEAESVLRWMQNDEGFLRTSNGGPVKQTPTTTLVYAPNHANQARTLAAAMHLPASALHGTGKGTGRMDPMVLTLGRDFRGVGLPPATPTPSAPPGCATLPAG